MSWKHFDMRTGRTEVRRARRLVISSISTIGNYEYASYWYLHQDGRIEYEMKATGIINTAGCIPANRENLAPRWRRALWATSISIFFPPGSIWK